MGVLEPRHAQEAGDRQDPGAEIGVGLEPGDLLPGAEEGFLDDFVAVLARAEIAGDEPRDARLMAAHQLRKRVAVHSG